MSGTYLASAMAFVVALTAVESEASAAGCGFRHKFTRSDEQGATSVKVFEGDLVATLGNIRPLLFITSLKVNTDGTKISYHKDDVTGRRCASDPSATPCGINNIRNAYRNSARPTSDFTAVRDAGFPEIKTWKVLSSDIIEKNAVTKQPCITSDGYLVSMTADVAVAGGFTRVGDCDQSKWIDALSMPAVVLPKATTSTPSQFNAHGIRKRSTVVAFSRSATNRVVAGIVGDFGPANEIGEANIAMNRQLNGLPESDLPKHRQDAIDRFQAGRTAVLLFPGNDMILARPISGARISEAGGAALEKFGGAQKVYDCIRSEVDATF
ncbi:hypothetical protein ACSBOB_07550 [Mesorhizobium sp. ASY16-5R]|uniref:hypothetical protein n=1 Tax=Mesorhizobium sp. ASY16-5R TaxID=3445772 RepID=UPI003F9F8D73